MKPAKLAKQFFSSLGPGLITGAADDDPSGVATYSVAGALCGTSLLWTALFTWPLMAVVQMMCARIGMVTGRGLAGALRKKIPRPVLIAACLALLTANTINVAADLAGMADAAEMLTGINSHFFVIGFGASIGWATIHFRYFQLAAVLKWLCLFLLAYVIGAFLVVSNWSEVLRDTFVPSMPHDAKTWSMLLAILGTTISPYLFFWQASQEVEEEKAMGRRMLVRREGASSKELLTRKLDVGVGTFFSNLVMYFIILVAAVTLHRHGTTNIETSRQAAEALKPLAGSMAATLYTVGILGVGFLAIPTLTGSAAYAFAETFAWRQGLDRKFRSARPFYSIIIGSTLLGILLDFLDVNPVKALVWTGVLNGLLAPFLLVAILLAAADAGIMKEQPSSMLSRVAVGVTALLMLAAAVGMFAL